MPEILWSQKTDGEQPDLVVGESRILMHRTVMRGGRKEIELICNNFDGRRQWCRPGWSVLLTLPGDQFVVNTPEGSPLVVDGSGQILHRSGFGGIERAVRHGSTLVFAGRKEAHATDLGLRGLWRIAWPGESAPAVDCVVDGAIHWVEGNWLCRCGTDAKPHIFCELPKDLIARRMDDWEWMTGNSALGGWYISSGMSDFAAFKKGDRPSFFYWRVAFDEEGQQFFLANALGPHLILCLDRDGSPRWCSFLCCGCCGGVPSALPDGRYVASSGCGGILSWLDREGQVLFQSVPHKGEGLATAYTSDVRVLPEGRCLADGGPGIVAYAPNGNMEWIFERSYSRFHCDPSRQILVGCHWETDEPTGQSVSWLEFAKGL